MNKKFSVVDLRLDQRVDSEYFVLKEFEKKSSKQGKLYYNVNFSDKTGEIRGKLWAENIPNLDENLEIGDIVLVNGLIQEYAGKLQIIATEIRKATDAAPEEFLSVTPRDRLFMQAYIEDEIKNISNLNIKELLELFWSNESIRYRFLNYPAAEIVHHAYLGGLLEHVYEMINLSKPYLKIYPMLDKDILLVGIIFHDIGKIEEFEIVGATMKRTNSGKLVAHIAQGVLIVDHLISQIPGFPEELRDKIFHLILSHQGELEFGSPIKPQTLEGLVLSFVDSNGASMNEAISHIAKSLDTGADFTDYHKYLARSLWQKDFLNSNFRDIISTQNS